MPKIIPPSELIKCDDIASCFQSLYNFFFIIFLALAFLIFLYGAFQYFLSPTGIFNKEEGKRRMQNSIIALIVVLIIPVILNFINPEIFKIQLSIPRVTVEAPSFEIDSQQLGEEISRDYITDVTTYNFNERGGLDPYICNAAPGTGSYNDPYGGELVEIPSDKCRFTNILPAPAPGIKKIATRRIVCDVLKKLDDTLRLSFNKKIYITAGYNHGYKFPDKCHTEVGSCLDIVPEGGLPYRELLVFLVQNGFYVLNESGEDLICPTENWTITKSCPTTVSNAPCYSTGSHFHIMIKIPK